MKDLTRRLWEEQDRHPGDRLRLFRAVGEFIGDTSVLYPGSFVDVAASFVFDSVTYVDNDRKAARFFADTSGVYEIINRHRHRLTSANWRFIGADYRTELDLADQSVGLLVSLYAGFVSEHCTRIPCRERGFWSTPATVTLRWRRSIRGIASLLQSTRDRADTRSPSVIWTAT